MLFDEENHHWFGQFLIRGDCIHLHSVVVCSILISFLCDWDDDESNAKSPQAQHIMYACLMNAAFCLGGFWH